MIYEKLQNIFWSSPGNKAISYLQHNLSKMTPEEKKFINPCLRKRAFNDTWMVAMVSGIVIFTSSIAFRVKPFIPTIIAVSISMFFGQNRMKLCYRDMLYLPNDPLKYPTVIAARKELSPTDPILIAFNRSNYGIEDKENGYKSNQINSEDNA